MSETNGHQPDAAAAASEWLRQLLPNLEGWGASFRCP
jgi:hypothetical protein